uniref:Metal-dependent protein hydrolase n=1 Tax=Pithovirus LCPAC406 TaxID=2506599 RepID=A0A481ZDJ8_9VIRU|nr:MAG: uncharacterized protein LCPAC406_02920 [Pithovirus LCPAC406]
MDKFILVGTHSGRFHADEVTAAAIISLIYPNIKLVRTRDKLKLSFCDILIDVGGVYDPKLLKFDHHQDDCQEFYSEEKTVPMSSAGMVYKHYGPLFLAKLQSEFNQELLELFYERFIKEIDIIDNGVHIEQDFYIKTGVSSIVHMLNYPDSTNDKMQMERFKEATDYVTNVMKITIRSLDISIRTSQNDIIKIKEAYSDRYQHDSEGRILVLKGKCSTWTASFKKFRKDVQNENVQFVIFQSKDKWKTGTITIGPHRRRSLNNEEVRSLSSFVFVHKERFIAEFGTKEDAIKAAVLSLS